MSQIVVELKPSEAAKQLEALFNAPAVNVAEKTRKTSGFDVKVSIVYKGKQYVVDAKHVGQKVKPLINLRWETGDGRQAFYRKISEEKSVMGWLDENGKALDFAADKLHKVQILVDGSKQEANFDGTRLITISDADNPDLFVSMDIVKQFHKERDELLWGKTPADVQILYQLALELQKDQKAVHIPLFVTGFKTKASPHWGFMYPQFRDDGNFVFVIMLSDAMIESHDVWMSPQQMSSLAAPQQVVLVVPSALEKLKNKAK